MYFLSASGDGLLGQHAKLLGVWYEKEHESKPSPSVSYICLHSCGLDNSSFGNLFVDRGIAQAAMDTLHKGVQVQFSGDSQVMIDGLLGRCCCKEPQIQRPMKLAHTALQMLLQCFSIRPPAAKDLAQQVPRASNSAADAAANWALDKGSFIDVRLPEVVHSSTT